MPHQSDLKVFWRALVRYLSFSTLGHLGWEIAQLPLYNVWGTANFNQLAFDVLHCTAGDILIATAALLVSLAIWRAWHWPRERFFHVAATSIALGLLYTAYSEWLNVYVRHSWSYAANMPTIGLFGYGIGLSPLLQWIAVPSAVFWLLRPRHEF